jgi:hypothetical protein
MTLFSIEIGSSNSSLIRIKEKTSRKFNKEDLLKLYVNLVRTAAYDQCTQKIVDRRNEGHLSPGSATMGVGGCRFSDPMTIYAHLAVMACRI